MVKAALGVGLAFYYAVVPWSTTPATEPKGEVVAASVRPNYDPAQGQSIRRLPGGRFTAVGASVRSLIQVAWQDQGVYFGGGGPAWISTDRFDVIAEFEGDPNTALRALLADRFKLSVRRERRTMGVYALQLARPGLPARGLRPSTEERERRVGDGFRGYTMASFITGLPAQVGRPVIDRTGLEGRWDFDLNAVAPPAPDSDQPSIFAALQELGLRLEPATAPLDVIVVLRLERPRAS